MRLDTKIPLTPIISPPTECTTGKEMFSANAAHFQVPSKALAANLIGKTSHLDAFSLRTVSGLCFLKFLN